MIRNAFKNSRSESTVGWACRGGCGGDGNDGMTFSSAELYDPRTGRWTLTGAMASVRFGHTATLLRNGQVLVAGGCCTGRRGPGLPSTSLSSAELYDPGSNDDTIRR